MSTVKRETPRDGCISRQFQPTLWTLIILWRDWQEWSSMVTDSEFKDGDDIIPPFYILLHIYILSKAIIWRSSKLWRGELVYWWLTTDLTETYVSRLILNLFVKQTQEWSSTKTLSILFSHIICSKRQFYNWEQSFIFMCYVSKQQCTEQKYMLNVYPILLHVMIFNDYRNIYVTSTTYYILHFISTEWYEKATMVYLLNTKITILYSSIHYIL